MKQNLLTPLPQNLTNEVTEALINASSVRIERIVSLGHSSPEEGWYDQEEHEWVTVLEGSGALQFDDGTEVVLEAGEYLNIPAHTRHRVLWTAADKPTIWLAVFYR